MRVQFAYPEAEMMRCRRARAVRITFGGAGYVWKRGLALTVALAMAVPAGPAVSADRPDWTSKQPYLEGAQEGAISPEEYRLQPGDQVMVVVSGATDYSYFAAVTPVGQLLLAVPRAAPGVIADFTQRETPLLDLGEIVVLPVGSAEVAGLSLLEAEKEMAKALARYIRDARVELTLLAVRQFRVFVTGVVDLPGTYPASPVMRASEVLEQAGLKPNASLRHITVVRGGERITVDLYCFERFGDASANPPLADGDIIHVREMEHSALVMGAVSGFGLIERQPVTPEEEEQMRVVEMLCELVGGETVEDVIAICGGLTPWADGENAYVDRGGERIPLHLDQRKGREASSWEIAVLPGDRLSIPALDLNVYVEGAVTLPGAYPYQPHRTISDYIGIAGGPSDRGHLRTTRLIRAATGETVRGNELTVEPGDRIVVPEVGLKWWQDYATLASAATALVLSWMAIVR